MFHESAITPAVKVHRRHKPRYSLEKRYKLVDVAAFIRTRAFTLPKKTTPFHRVALQFPDDLLADAVAVTRALKSILENDVSSSQTEVADETGETAAMDNQENEVGNEKIRLFVVADSTFGSCCPDEITAQHYGSECIIHFGTACMSRSTRIPVFYVHEDFHFSAFASFSSAEEEEFSVQLVLRAVSFLQDRLNGLCQSLGEKNISVNAKLVVVGSYSSRNFVEAACCRWRGEHSEALSAGGTIDVEWGSYESVGKTAACMSDVPQMFDENSSWVISGVRFSCTDSTTLQRFLFIGPSNSFMPLHLLNVHQHNLFHHPEALREEATCSSHLAALTVLDESFFLGTKLEEIARQRNNCGDNSNNIFKDNFKNDNSSGINFGIELDAALEAHFFSGNSVNKLNTFQSLLEKRLRQRAFNVELIRSSTTIGIVVASLAIKGYYETTILLNQLLRAYGKRSYIIYIGHLNKYKIANFVDSVDCFVVIACPNCREGYFPMKDDDFSRPIVTPIEVILALQTGGDDFALFGHQAAYSTTFDSVLPLLRKSLQAVSAENARTDTATSADVALVEKNGNSTALICQSSGVVATQFVSGALARLHRREFVGLNPRKGQTPVQEKIVEGRHGIARGYTSERDSQRLTSSDNITC